MNKCQENIKFLIPRPITPFIKPPIHRSVFTESIKRVYNLNKDCHRTMGYAEVQLNPPSQFLKKHTRKVIRPFVEKIKCNKKSPRIPKQVKSTSETKPKENIINRNIVDATRGVPPLPKHRFQDSRNGHIIVLNEAGLEPIHVCKKNYGKTPKYIVKMLKKKEMIRKTEEVRKQALKPPLRLIPQKERDELLTGLKTNWAELHKEFLLLPMLIDTESKIRRKVMLEKELANLEKDIDILERNPNVYVCQEEEE